MSRTGYKIEIGEISRKSVIGYLNRLNIYAALEGIFTDCQLSTQVSGT